MMLLSNKQKRFTECVCDFLNFAREHGYQLTIGDAYRDPRAFGEFGTKRNYSHRYSMHKLRLAIDWNLFVDGEYITDGDHPAWYALGNYWESLDRYASWGGRFGDANHFSFTHRGYK